MIKLADALEFLIGQQGILDFFVVGNNRTRDKLIPIIT